MHTQFGALWLRAHDGAIVALGWGATKREDASTLLDWAVEEILAYDAGELETFTVPLRVTGSQLQSDVCEAMRAIPFGETVTYGDIAKSLGVPAQAVGQACGANPIPIIIPCHRVLGAKGLTGFSGAGGVETKVALLRHEKAGAYLI